MDYGIDKATAPKDNVRKTTCFCNVFLQPCILDIWVQLLPIIMQSQANNPTIFGISTIAICQGEFIQVYVNIENRKTCNVVVFFPDQTSLRGPLRVSEWVGQLGFRCRGNTEFLLGCFFQHYQRLPQDMLSIILPWGAPLKQVVSYEVVFYMETPGNATRGQITLV